MHKNRAGRWMTMPVVMALALVAGCGVLGVPKPESFGDKIQAAYHTIGAVRDTGRRLLQAGRIDAEEAQVIQDRADEMRAGLELARGIRKTSEVGAESRLATALGLAQIVTDCMTEREVERPTDAPPLPSLAVCIQQKDPPT